jgi:hypothetical protein
MRVIVVALMLTVAAIQAKPQTVPSKSSAPIQTPDRAKTTTTAPAPQNAALKQGSSQGHSNDGCRGFRDGKNDGD